MCIHVYTLDFIHLYQFVKLHTLCVNFYKCTRIYRACASCFYVMFFFRQNYKHVAFFESLTRGVNIYVRPVECTFKIYDHHDV